MRGVRWPSSGFQVDGGSQGRCDVLVKHTTDQPKRRLILAAAVIAACSVITTGQPPARPAPAALLDGARIEWSELEPLFAEAAGAQVIQEAALDRLVAAELRTKGLSITEDDVIRERARLSEAIVRDARATPDDAERLIETLRRSRGLGEARFRKLLERNAKMRKLVAPTVQVSDEEVAQAFALLHGLKSRVRVIVLSSRTQAATLHRQLATSSDGLRVRFAEAAMESSVDTSAARGGLIEGLSSADPAFPASLREAVAQLEPGGMTDVLDTDAGSVIAMLEARIPADDIKLADKAGAIRAEVLARRERQAMDDLARVLLAKADLKVMDRGLEWSLSASKLRGAP